MKLHLYIANHRCSNRPRRRPRPRPRNRKKHNGVEDEDEFEDEDETRDELNPLPATLIWNQEVSLSIKLAAFQASGADT
jgi:hypothetical protein